MLGISLKTLHNKLKEYEVRANEVRMKFNLRTKLTIATAALVLGVVAVISVVYLATLTKQVIRQAQGRAAFVAQEIFLQAQQALVDAAEHGEGPGIHRPARFRTT